MLYVYIWICSISKCYMYTFRARTNAQIYVFYAGMYIIIHNVLTYIILTTLLCLKSSPPPLISVFHEIRQPKFQMYLLSCIMLSSKQEITSVLIQWHKYDWSSTVVTCHFNSAVAHTLEWCYILFLDKILYMFNWYFPSCRLHSKHSEFCNNELLLYIVKY